MIQRYEMKIGDGGKTAYRTMLAALKVAQQDVQILHRYLISDDFIANHEFLDSVYKEMAVWLDELAELGIALGVYEPNIDEALSVETPIRVEFRTLRETMDELIRICDFVYSDMERLKDTEIPSDVISKVEEYQLKLRVLAGYKAEQVLYGDFDR